MDGNHNIYLQWTATITYTYNGWIPFNLLTMGSYHNIYLQLTITIASTYIEWVPYLLFTVKCYHSICLQWKVTIISTYNEHMYLWTGPYMIPLIAPPPLFFNIDLFSCTQTFATFYVWHIYNKNNQTVVSIHTGFLTDV